MEQSRASRMGMVLYAKDLDRVAAFYGAVLGLAAKDRDDEHVVLDSAAFQVVILRIPASIASRIQIEAPPVRRADVPIKPVFFVTSLADVRASAEARGGMVGATHKEWVFDGWRVVDGLDPEGNVVQFRERVPDAAGAGEGKSS